MHILSHNDPECHPDLCSVCHVPWSWHVCFGDRDDLSGPDLPICTPFRPTISAALDALTIAQEALGQAKAALEDEVMP